MSNGLEWMTNWLQDQTNIYIALVVWVVFYLLIDILLTQLAKKQKARKKRVIERLKPLKEPYLQRQELKEEEQKMREKVFEYLSKYDNVANGHAKWIGFKEGMTRIITENRIIEALRLEKKLNQEEISEIQRESKIIIKEEKSKASLPFLSFLFKIFLFISLLKHFSNLDAIESSLLLVFITTIVSFFATVTRKTAVIFLVIALISFFVYRLFNGSVLWFLLYYWTGKGILFRYKQWKAWKEKK